MYFYHSTYLAFVRSQICSFVTNKFISVPTWGENSNNQQRLTMFSDMFTIVCKYIVLWQDKLVKNQEEVRGSKRKWKYWIREVIEKEGNIYKKMQFILRYSLAFGNSWNFTSRNLWKKWGTSLNSDIHYICVSYLKVTSAAKVFFLP